MENHKKILSISSSEYTSFEIPTVTWHYLNPDALPDFAEVKGKIFFTGCARCGERILVRASEHPYIRRKGNKIAFLCKACDPLFIDIGQPDTERPRDHFIGYWEHK